MPLVLNGLGTIVGTLGATTPAVGDDDTSLATTAFVNAEINSGLIPASFTTLSVAGNSVSGDSAGSTLTNKTLASPVLTNPSYSGATVNGGTVTTIDINGGTIDGTVIGGSSAAAGSFTTLSGSTVRGYDIRPNVSGLVGSLYWLGGWKSDYAAGGATWGIVGSNDGSGISRIAIADASTGVGATATNVKDAITFYPSGAVTIPGSLAVSGNTTLGDSAAATVTVNGITTYAAGATVSDLKVTELNSGPLAGFRNRVINGDMRIDQRNNGAAVQITSAWAAFYPVDRFIIYSNAAPTALYAQRVSGDANSMYALRLSRTSGTYANNLTLTQAIETNNCIDLSGKQVTISARVRCGSAWLGGNVALTVSTGTGIDQGALISAAGGWLTGVSVFAAALTPTTTFTKISGTVTIPVGTTEIAIGFGPISATFTGTGSANDYVEITDIQLEPGTVATPFEFRPYQVELALCQRYYYRTSGQAAGSAFGAGFTDSTTVVQIVHYFPVTMRIAPTALEQSGTAADYTIRKSAGGATACSAVPIFGAALTNSASVVLTVASGLTAGQAVHGRAANTTSYLGWSAEL